jgi:autotransporter adhesin
MAIAIPSAPGRTAVNFGVGAYEGYKAVGASVAYLSSNGRYNVSGGLSSSGGKSVARVGVGFSF